MDEKRVWTYKDARLPTLVDDLHRHGQRYVPAVVSSVYPCHVTETV